MAVNDLVAVDASVAVKWLVEEDQSVFALALLRNVQHDLNAVIVPPHFAGEVTNAVYQKLRTQDPVKHIAEAEARRAIANFRLIAQTSVRVIAEPEIYDDALDFAQQHGLPSIYDALYVVLARQLQVELWTADRRLLNNIGSVAPWVRWIGDYPVTES